MLPTLKPFALLLTVHLLGDVFFTSCRLSLLKGSSTGVIQVLGVALHCCVHALFAGILLTLCNEPWIKGQCRFFLFHFLIDLIRYLPPSPSPASGGSTLGWRFEMRC
jgi:hypothetical protein